MNKISWFRARIPVPFCDLAACKCIVAVEAKLGDMSHYQENYKK